MDARERLEILECREMLDWQELAESMGYEEDNAIISRYVEMREKDESED